LGWNIVVFICINCWCSIQGSPSETNLLLFSLIMVVFDSFSIFITNFTKSIESFIEFILLILWFVLYGVILTLLSILLSLESTIVGVYISSIPLSHDTFECFLLWFLFSLCAGYFTFFSCNNITLSLGSILQFFFEDLEFLWSPFILVGQCSEEGWDIFVVGFLNS
jgi:hypothetical protein